MPAIIVLGIVRGTLFGPIKDLEAVVGTAYGLTWLASLLVAIGLFVWGLRVIEPALHRMDAAPLGPDGAATPELVAATNRVKRLVGVELLGFILIFSRMILMRFGL